MDILALLQCLAPLLSATTLRHLSRIIFALLAMTGRVTMLGLSRWAGTGGSYRTVQRFFSRVAKSAGGSSLQASQDRMRDHGESADAGAGADGGSPVPAAALARH